MKFSNRDDQFKYIRRKLKKVKMINKLNTDSSQQNQKEEEVKEDNKESNDNSTRIQSRGFNSHFRNLVKKSKNLSQ